MEQFEYLLSSKVETHLANPEIQSTYKCIKKSIKELQDLEHKKQGKEFIKYIKTFSKLMEKIGKDVKTAKERYENINKKKLIEDRSEELATNINLFREEALLSNAEIHRTEEQLREITLKNQATEFQIECLKDALRKKEEASKCAKEIYITQAQTEANVEFTAKQRLIDATTKLDHATQCKTLSSFNNYRDRQTKISSKSKRSNFQQRKMNKIWNYSASLNSRIEE